MASRLLILRRLSRILPRPSYSSIYASSCIGLVSVDARTFSGSASNPYHFLIESCRRFSSGSLNVDESQGPTAIDYSSLMQVDEFHRLADSTIHDLQERFEDYGDSIDLDGFDIDYGNDVLTLKLGDLGTYVLNKQTPNRQIWLSSPVSGPSRYDWDKNSQSWIYRRTKANLFKVLETEVENLCGQPIKLS